MMLRPAVLIAVCLTGWTARATEPLGEPPVEPAGEHPAFVDQGPDAASRLVGVYRRLYLAIPPEQRMGLLAELISDPLEEVRTFGVDLTLRESSAGTVISPAVGAAGVRLLGHHEPDARRQGAVLLARLQPDGWFDAMIEALATENDPAAGGAMLRALSKRASHETLQAVLRWIETDGPAFEPATLAARTAIASGFFGTEQRSQILTALRTKTVATLPRDAMTLLVELGTDDDRRGVIGLLGHADEGVRGRAAWALSGWGESVGVLVEAAGLDAVLLPQATAAGGLHGVTTEQYIKLARVEPPSGFDRLGGLLAPAGAFTNRQLVETAIGLDRADPLRESMLVLLTDPERSRDQVGAVMAGVVLLGEDRLRDDRPEAALAALMRLPEGADLFTQLRGGRVRVIANLMLGKVEPARQAMRVPVPGIWLDGLARCVDRPWGLTVAQEIGREVMPRMNESERARYAELVLLLPVEEVLAEP